MRLVLDGGKMSRSPQPLVRILKVHIEALSRIRQVYCPGGLNITLSLKAKTLKMALAAGTVGKIYIPRMRKGEAPLIARV